MRRRAKAPLQRGGVDVRVRGRGDAALPLRVAPLGRQELWEDSPAGYPQTEPYKWQNWHDNYSPDGKVDPEWDKVSSAGVAAFKRGERVLYQEGPLARIRVGSGSIIARR